MASASFRESMNSLGWSRREPDAPVNTAPPSVLDRLSTLNPFGAGGYVRLPISETNPGAPLPAPTRREEEEGWFARKCAYLLAAHLRPHIHPAPLRVSPALHDAYLKHPSSCAPLDRRLHLLASLALEAPQ
jgi:hypothetical protein